MLPVAVVPRVTTSARAHKLFLLSVDGNVALEEAGRLEVLDAVRADGQSFATLTHLYSYLEHEKSY